MHITTLALAFLLSASRTLASKERELLPSAKWAKRDVYELLKPYDQDLNVKAKHNTTTTSYIDSVNLDDMSEDPSGETATILNSQSQAPKTTTYKPHQSKDSDESMKDSSKHDEDEAEDEEEDDDDDDDDQFEDIMEKNVGDPDQKARLASLIRGALEVVQQGSGMNFTRGESIEIQDKILDYLVHTNDKYLRDFITSGNDKMPEYVKENMYNSESTNKIYTSQAQSSNHFVNKDGKSSYGAKSTAEETAGEDDSHRLTTEWSGEDEETKPESDARDSRKNSLPYSQQEENSDVSKDVSTPFYRHGFPYYGAHIGSHGGDKDFNDKPSKVGETSDWPYEQYVRKPDAQKDEDDHNDEEEALPLNANGLETTRQAGSNEKGPLPWTFSPTVERADDTKPTSDKPASEESNKLSSAKPSTLFVAEKQDCDNVTKTTDNSKNDDYQGKDYALLSSASAASFSDASKENDMQEVDVNKNDGMESIETVDLQTDSELDMSESKSNLWPATSETTAFPTSKNLTTSPYSSYQSSEPEYPARDPVNNSTGNVVVPVTDFEEDYEQDKNILSESEEAATYTEPKMQVKAPILNPPSIVNPPSISAPAISQEESFNDNKNVAEDKKTATEQRKPMVEEAPSPIEQAYQLPSQRRPLGGSSGGQSFEFQHKVLPGPNGEQDWPHNRPLPTSYRKVSTSMRDTPSSLEQPSPSGLDADELNEKSDLETNLTPALSSEWSSNVNVSYSDNPTTKTGPSYLMTKEEQAKFYQQAKDEIELGRGNESGEGKN